MENKKEYAEPEMKIVNLNTEIQLLQESCGNEESCGNGFGLAPHEQDPIA